MSKVTMPEPVAWLIDWPDEPGLGHYFAEEPASNCRSQPLITTEQAESYAAAKLREALESHERNLRNGLLGLLDFDRQSVDLAIKDASNATCALIPTNALDGG